MFSTASRQAAETEFGRRHYLMVKFGGRVAGVLLLGVLVAGGCWLAVRVAGSLDAPGMPSLSMPDVPLPGRSVVTVLAVVPALVVVWRVVAFIRSPYRLGWRSLR